MHNRIICPKNTNMKKLMIFATALAFTVAACNPSNNNPGESGAQNDGIKPVDQNGGLQDTGYEYTPQTDTAKKEHRTDVSDRD
jgi:hypothetical protein